MKSQQHSIQLQLEKIIDNMDEHTPEQNAQAIEDWHSAISKDFRNGKNSRMLTKNRDEALFNLSPNKFNKLRRFLKENEEASYILSYFDASLKRADFQRRKPYPVFNAYDELEKITDHYCDQLSISLSKRLKKILIDEKDKIGFFTAKDLGSKRKRIVYKGPAATSVSYKGNEWPSNDSYMHNKAFGLFKDIMLSMKANGKVDPMIGDSIFDLFKEFCSLDPACQKMWEVFQAAVAVKETLRLENDDDRDNTSVLLKKIEAYGSLLKEKNSVLKQYHNPTWDKFVNVVLHILYPFSALYSRVKHGMWDFSLTEGGRLVVKAQDAIGKVRLFDQESDKSKQQLKSESKGELKKNRFDQGNR